MLAGWVEVVGRRLALCPMGEPWGTQGSRSCFPGSDNPTAFSNTEAGPACPTSSGYHTTP